MGVRPLSWRSPGGGLCASKHSNGRFATKEVAGLPCAIRVLDTAKSRVAPRAVGFLEEEAVVWRWSVIIPDVQGMCPSVRGCGQGRFGGGRPGPPQNVLDP